MVLSIIAASTAAGIVNSAFSCFFAGVESLPVLWLGIAGKLRGSRPIILNFARPHFSSTQSLSSEVSATSSPSVSRTISKSLRALRVKFFSLPEHATCVRIPTSRSVALKVSAFPLGSIRTWPSIGTVVRRSTMPCTSPKPLSSEARSMESPMNC